MAAPEFDATGFVRSVLRSIVFYLSIIVISSMTMVKPAQAEGAVNPSVTYWGGGNNIGFNCNGMASVSALQDCEKAKREKWLADDHDWLVSRGAGNIVSCSAPALNDYGPTGNYVDHFSVTYYRIAYNCGYGYYCNYLTFCQLQPVVHYYIYTKTACPANTTTTTPPCTCKDGYEPDSTGTSCVPVSTCPVPALKPLPEDAACAQVLENISSAQAQKDAACGKLSDKLIAGIACFRDKLTGMSPAIPLKITSDIRDVAYQAHLREIWDKMELLVALEDDPVKKNACAARRAEIAAEKGCDNADVCTSCYSESTTQRSHCLKGMPAPPNANDAQHTQGNAFDVSGTYTIAPLLAALGARRPPETIPQYLDAPPTNCNLIWGGTFKTNNDPVHFLAR